jgi:hypothetical protein
MVFILEVSLNNQLYYIFFFAEALIIRNIYLDMPCLSTVEAENLSKMLHCFTTVALFMMHSVMFSGNWVGKRDLIIWLLTLPDLMPLDF